MLNRLFQNKVVTLIALMLVAVIVIAGASIILLRNPSQPLPQAEMVIYEDEYTSFSFDTNLWSVTSDMQESLHTTALTLSYIPEEQLNTPSAVSILAIPPNDAYTGETILTNMRDYVSQIYECRNVELAHAKVEGADHTFTSYEYIADDGSVIYVEGLAREMDKGTIIFMLTMQGRLWSPAEKRSWNDMVASSSMRSIPRAEGLLIQEEGALGVASLLLPSGEMTFVTVFEAHSGSGSSEVQTNTQNVSIEYKTIEVSENVETALTALIQEIAPQDSARYLGIKPGIMPADEDNILGQLMYSDSEALSEAEIALVKEHLRDSAEDIITDALEPPVEDTELLYPTHVEYFKLSRLYGNTFLYIRVQINTIALGIDELQDLSELSTREGIQLFPA